MKDCVLCCGPLGVRTTTAAGGCDREGHGRGCGCESEGRHAQKEAEVGCGCLKIRYNKGVLLLGSLGAVFIAIATAIYAFDPLEMISKAQLSLKDGSYTDEAWRKPPVKIGLKIYIFNYTNSEAFLRGEEKLRVEEIGPYLYTESLENTNVKYNDNNSVTYTPVRSVVRSPEMDHVDLNNVYVVVPNVVFLGVLSYLADHSLFANMAFNTLSTFMGSQPFLTMTLQEYLWDYDDPIIKYANKLAPETIHFEQFGYLDRMFDEGHNVVTMNLNGDAERREDGRVVEPLSIEAYNGYPGLKHWGYDASDDRTLKRCNLLQGYATDGVLFPRNIAPNQTFVIYRKAFCRTLEIVHDRQEATSSGFTEYHYKLREDAFDSTNAENSCFCNRKRGPCLPRGLSDISPCYYNIPIAVSFPHFYNGDQRLVDAIDGLSPNRESHATNAVIQPKMGLLMRAHSRIQTNLVMKNTKYNSKSEPFNNMIVPIFWVDFYFDELPADLANLVTFVVLVAPVLQKAVIVALGAAGLVLAALSLVNVSSLLRVASRQHRKQSTLWRAGYETVQIVPIIRRESLGIRRESLGIRRESLGVAA